MTKRLALLLVLLTVSIGAVVVPKLYWKDEPVSLTCDDMEHAVGVLEIVQTLMKTSAGDQCMPGEPECIAEAWMYFEAIELQRFIAEIHSLACQDL